MMMIIGLLYVGVFEFIREGGRRPYIIYDYMYSTSMLKKDVPRIAAEGVLRNSRWAEHKEITAENRYEAGQELYRLMCMPCHSFGGPLNDMKPLAARLQPGEHELIISTMGKERAYMPPFAGTDEEKSALVHFLANLPTD